MDAKSHLKLADDSGASWLLLTDEARGAVLSGTVFPPLGVGTGRRCRRTSAVARGLSAMGQTAETAP